MTQTVSSGAIRGTVAAIPSKSALHRLLICAALAESPTQIHCDKAHSSDDVAATIACLTALGAIVEQNSHGFFVVPINRNKIPEKCVLHCGESGATLRFMLPVACALGVSARFKMAGRLPARPIDPLVEQLTKNGAKIWRISHDTLCCENRLKPGVYQIRGDISSQFVTGMLLALPQIEGHSSLIVTKPIESEGYIHMTLDAAGRYGFAPDKEQNTDSITYHIHHTPFVSPKNTHAEGDWSNAAFWLCAGAMPGGNVSVTGLDIASLQGDKGILHILEKMGAIVVCCHDTISVSEGRRGIELDASATPDLVPPVAALAAVSEGVTVIKNAARLRFKEADRLAAITGVLNALGGNVTRRPGGLIIKGVGALQGGETNSYGDHRIAMMAAVAACASKHPVTIKDAGAVSKSYPNFFKKLLDIKERM